MRDIYFDKDKITFPMLDIKKGADMTKVTAEINIEEDDTRVPETKSVEKVEEKTQEDKKATRMMTTSDAETRRRATNPKIRWKKRYPGSPWTTLQVKQK